MSAKTIGKYEIEADLGRGAFTRVYRAFDPVTNRLAAVKVPAEESEKDLFAYFHREAVAVNNLDHENIVKIYDWGEDRGLPFLAVEYLQGETLRSAIARRRPFTLQEKIRIMSQIGAALSCAHRSGVIHLDLKPANILVQADGSVKIMDFGMVELSEQTAARLAQQGYLSANLLYAAPEQFGSSAGIDTTGDVFAYGVIYYELLTGIHPFQAADAKAVMSRIVSEDPFPVSKLAADCPQNLEWVVHRTLHKDPKFRYQSLADLQSDIGPILLELERVQALPPVVVAAARWKRPAIVAGTVFGLVAGAGVLHWRSPRSGSQAPVENPPAVAPAPSQPESFTSAAPPGQAPARPARRDFDPSPLLQAKAVQPQASFIQADGLPPPPPKVEVPEATGPERIGGNFQEAKLIGGPPPQLPMPAAEAKIYGTVELEVTISKEGLVTAVTVLSGHPFLASAAKDAAMQRRYQPATLNGDPIEIKAPVQIVFQPNQ